MMRSKTTQKTTSAKLRFFGAALATAAAVAGSPSAQGQVWATNTAKQNILRGETLVAKRIDTADLTRYCEIASTPQTHFTWVDTAGSGLDYTHAWSLWAAACPGAVATMRGAELMYLDRVEPVSGAIPSEPALREMTEQEVQRAADGGAVVLMVPVDSAEQAAQLVKRSYFPPLGTRSHGPGQAETIYGNVTAAYRASYNDNVVLVAIVSTVEGSANAAAIARTPGIHALFLDAMNLESSSGYVAGNTQYEKLAHAIRVAAQSNRKHLCTVDRSTSPHTLTCSTKTKS